MPAYPLHIMRTHEPMEMILSESCCGKTSLCKASGKYMDFDIFSKAHGFSVPLVRAVIKAYLPCCDESKTYLFNATSFFEYGLDGIDGIRVSRIILPDMTAESIRFRRSVFEKRDIANYGFVRSKQLRLLAVRYGKAHEFAARHFPKITVETIRENQFIKDII